MSRNALMDRVPMQAGPPQQMAAAPPTEPPANPLTQRRGLEQPQDMDPTSIFLGKAKALGIDIEQALKGGADQRQVLNEAMKAIWKAEPTDENGEMIEELSKHLGVPPPWQQGDGMMKLGGPTFQEASEAGLDMSKYGGAKAGADEEHLVADTLHNEYEAGRSYNGGSDPFMSHYDNYSGRQPWQEYGGQNPDPRTREHLDNYMMQRRDLMRSRIKERMNQKQK